MDVISMYVSIILSVKGRFPLMRLGVAIGMAISLYQGLHKI